MLQQRRTIQKHNIKDANLVFFDAIRNRGTREDGQPGKEWARKRVETEERERVETERDKGRDRKMERGEKGGEGEGEGEKVTSMQSNIHAKGHPCKETNRQKRERD